SPETTDGPSPRLRPTRASWVDSAAPPASALRRTPPCARHTTEAEPVGGEAEPVGGEAEPVGGEAEPVGGEAEPGGGRGVHAPASVRIVPHAFLLPPWITSGAPGAASTSPATPTKPAGAGTATAPPFSHESPPSRNAMKRTSSSSGARRCSW